VKLSFVRVVLPVVALAMAGLGFYHVARESESAPATAPPKYPAQSPFKDSIAATGMVEPLTENIAIGAALAGLVLEVYVPTDKVGTKVAAGQPLFRVDDRHLKAQLKVAEAQLELATANLVKLENQPRPGELPVSLAKVKAADAKMASLKYQLEIAEKLMAKGALAEEEFVIKKWAYETSLHDQAHAQADYDLLKAGAWQPDLKIAKVSIATAQAQVEQLKTEIDRATVVAPVAGTVLQVNVRAGEYISAQNAKALMVLGDVSTYHVRVDIDERDIARFKKGAVAKAYPRGAAGQELTLHFVRVEPFVVPKKSLTGENTERVDTRVLQVVYAIEAPKNAVYVGQQLDVFIDAGHPEGAK
jgi:multidrug resistance efflux pump